MGKRISVNKYGKILLDFQSFFRRDEGLKEKAIMRTSEQGFFFNLKYLFRDKVDSLWNKIYVLFVVCAFFLIFHNSIMFVFDANLQ